MNFFVTFYSPHNPKKTICRMNSTIRTAQFNSETPLGDAYLGSDKKSSFELNKAECVQEKDELMVPSIELLRSMSFSSDAPSMTDATDTENSPIQTDYYPNDPRLPFHFSWVDDGMIGGCSIPSTKMHYRALSDNGVGLIVNVTENPIVPATTEYGCHKINSHEFVNGRYDDIFDDIHPQDDLSVLFLPVRDGEVPTFEQIHRFISEAKKFIRNGKKVVVHCQAGIGRTGIMLASFLIDKYSITASVALSDLRSIRPHSLQFNSFTWSIAPFMNSQEFTWSPNPIQEVFLDMFYDSMYLTSDNAITNSTENEMSDYYRSIIGGLLDTPRSEDKCCFACMKTTHVGPLHVYNGSTHLSKFNKC